MNSMQKAIKHRRGGLLIKIEPDHSDLQQDDSGMITDGQDSEEYALAKKMQEDTPDHDSQEYALAKEFADGADPAGNAKGLVGRMRQEAAQRAQSFEEPGGGGGVSSEKLDQMKQKRRNLEKQNDEKARKGQSDS